MTSTRPKTTHRPHGIIIGGGIGGMALAAALERVGISFEVHEQAEELREVGTGLTLYSNALIALDRLGAAKPVMSLGSREDRFEIRAASGRVLAVTPLARAQRRFGMPGCICVHRADLLRELVSLSRATQVYVRSHCVRISEKANQVTACFADGETRQGDFLIGADGLHSVVRTQLLGESEPRYAGYTCWRGIAELDPSALLPANTAFEAWGPGRRFSIHPCGAGRVFWYATHNRPAWGTDGPSGRKADVQELFSSWHEPIPSVIAVTSATLRNDILDRPPARTWGRGRITLLGDAAHPTTPNLGQGACQALEDAVVLADRLRAKQDVEAALREYERVRQPRTERITTESHRFGEFTQSENPVVRGLANLAVRLMPPAAAWWSMERFLHADLPVI